MKKLIFTTTFALMCVMAYAVPAKRGLWKSVKTADGSEVRVELTGDEFFHYWKAADGRKFIRNARTGLFEAADVTSMSKQAEARRNATNAGRARRAPAMRVTPGQPHTPYTGEKKGLIILVDFADKTFEAAHTRDLFDQIANAENFSNDMGFRGSVRDYFRDQSYGQFTLDFDVVGPVQMPEEYAYYGNNDTGNSFDEMRVGQMVKDACMAVDGEVNFADYDWDGDGEVDQVFILYAGHGEASYDDPNTIWPHEWDLVSAMAQWDDNGNVVSLGERLAVDGVYVNTYACGCELGSGDNIDGIGTICHEFSHCLGLPDMYDTVGSNYGMSMWSLMDQGSYNGDSFIPAAYTAYERMYAGWLKPDELTDNAEITAMQGINDGEGKAYIIYNDGNSNEYFLLENRQRTGWDAGLPGSGLLITHVDFNEQVWAYNQVNSTSRQRCTVVLADNRYDGRYNTKQDYLNDLAGDIYPTAYNNTFSNSSSPAAELNNANRDGSFMLNKTVRNITKNDDGTISFIFENENNAPEDYDRPESYIFYESFDNCAGRGGNDGVFNVNTVGSIVYDNAGWTSPNGRPASKCVRLGSTTPGQITTPEIDINGEYNLWFKAAPYTGASTTLTIEVASGNATLGKTQFVMRENTWSALNTTITADGPVKLRFKTSSGMFYLDEVCITAEDVATGIDKITASPAVQTKAADNRIYTIDGRYVGTDVNKLSKGLYIRNGEKFIKR